MDTPNATPPATAPEGSAAGCAWWWWVIIVIVALIALWMIWGFFRPSPSGNAPGNPIGMPAPAAPGGV